MPGGIDVHTHLDMPFGGTSSSDDFETGTRAAAYGGTTSIIDFAIQSKGEALRQGLDRWHAKAEGKAAIDYGFHLIMTDVNEPVAAEMAQVVSEGVTSFKLFMAYPGALMTDDGQIFRAMQRGGELGAMICIHAESGLPIEVLVQQALAAGHTAPRYHALTRPEMAEAEAPTAPSAWPRWRRRRSIWFISRRPGRCGTWLRPATAAWRPTPRPVRSISFSRRPTSSGRGSRERSTSARPRCARRRPRRISGGGCIRTTCRSSPPITAPSA